jgi:hypothetical protein
MLNSEFGFLYVLAIMVALILLLRFLHKNIDKLWVRVLYLPFGPKTDVKYMTRSELFKSASGFLICGTYLVLLLIFTILLTSPFYKNTGPGPFLSALIYFIIPVICAVFFCAAFCLFIRGLFRSKNYLAPNAVLVHGSFVPNSRIEGTLEYCRSQDWQKQNWQPKPGLVRKRTGFLAVIKRYTGQDYDLNKFELTPGSWKYDNCIICSWRFKQGDDPETSVGYTNGRDWLCSECYERFIHAPAPQEVNV